MNHEINEVLARKSYGKPELISAQARELPPALAGHLEYANRRNVGAG